MRTGSLDAAALEKLVTAAAAAPSIHNTQPWRFSLDPDTSTLEVRGVTARSLRFTEPRHRALHVSVGAALFNLRLAIEHFGWRPQVRLAPDRARPDVLATVRLAAGADKPTAAHAGLYAAVWQRRSSRLPFTGKRLPTGVVTALGQAAREEGTTLRVPPATAVVGMLEVTAEAERRNERSPQRRAESRSWVRDEGRDGMPLHALGPRTCQAGIPMRAFTGPGAEGRFEAAAFEDHATIAVLTTPCDRPVDWLKAGQALEAVLLTATAHEVRSSLLYQALEWRDLRAALLVHDRGLSGHPQMLVRLGYGPAGPETPRLRIGDVWSGARAPSSEKGVPA